MKLTGNNH